MKGIMDQYSQWFCQVSLLTYDEHILPTGPLQTQ